MNLTDTSVTSSHYYYSKRMETTEENLNLDTELWFKRVKRPSRLVLPRNGLRTSPTKKKNHILLTPQTHKNMTNVTTTTTTTTTTATTTAIVICTHSCSKLILKVNIRVLAA